MDISLFGPFRATIDDRPVAHLFPEKVRALFAILVADRGYAHTRSSLVGLLWPDASEEAARHSLRQALAILRRALGDERAGSCLRATRQTIEFVPDPMLSLDIVRFTSLLRACATGQHKPGAICATCNEGFQAAIDLYTGPFLDQLVIADSAEFESWAQRKREEYQRLAVKALDQLAHDHAHLGNYAAASAVRRRQIALEPWNELHRYHLMQSLVHANEYAQALTEYRACCHALQEHFGLEPSTEIQALYHQIMVRRQQVDQSANDDRPRKPTVHPRPAPQTHFNALPTPLTTLIGREREVVQVVARLEQPTSRLLTLAGPGGVGKTVLALTVAEHLLRTFTHGVCWVPLAQVEEPEHVLNAIAHALQIIPTGGLSLLDTLKQELRGRQMLLVLDNFEHLLDAAPVVTALLQAAPRLKVLITSRERLNLYGEQSVAVAPLALPQPSTLLPLEHLREVPAVQLFVERAQATNSNWVLTPANAAAVVELCRRLDGLPLAIELAAGRSNHFSPAQMLTRLADRFKLLIGGGRDRPMRQQTLSNVIAWSYDLLEPGQQALLCHLGAFAGGCTLEAIQALETRLFPDGRVGTSDEFEIQMQILVDKHLVRMVSGSHSHTFFGAAAVEARYGLLETIRAYAWEHIRANDEEALVRQAHAVHYLALAEQFDVSLLPNQELSQMLRLIDELENFHLALGWFHERCDSVSVMRLASALLPVWLLGAYVEEGRHWLRMGLEQASAEGATSGAALARALFAGGMLALNQGDLQDAEMQFERALPLLDGVDELWMHISTLAFRGVLRLPHADLGRARAEIEHALALARRSGDPRALAVTLSALSTVEEMCGDLCSGIMLREESLTVARSGGFVVMTVNNLLALGLRALMAGDAWGALAFFAEALPLLRQLGDRGALIGCLRGLAGAIARAAEQGRDPAQVEQDLQHAARLFGAADVLQAPIGSLQQDLAADPFTQELVRIRAELMQPQWAAAWEEGETMSIDKVIEYVLEAANDIRSRYEQTSSSVSGHHRT